MANHGETMSAALRYALPTSVDRTDSSEAGWLVLFGPNDEDAGRRTAALIDKILNGARPTDLLVEQPTKFGLIINRKTAKALGTTIAQSILLHADEVIQ